MCVRASFDGVSQRVFWVSMLMSSCVWRCVSGSPLRVGERGLKRLLCWCGLAALEQLPERMMITVASLQAIGKVGRREGPKQTIHGKAQSIPPPPTAWDMKMLFKK